MKYIFLILLVITYSTNAIIIRHDTSDSDYKELAKRDNSTVTFYGIYKGEEIVAGTGSIVADTWIITAAHVANYLTAKLHPNLPQRALVSYHSLHFN